MAAQRNVYADMLLMHFYRWLRCGSASKLHDPCLFKLIHGMMRKVFFQLLAEFRRLGAKVIYATFNKIIVGTNKHSVPNATAYVDYVLRSVKKQQLFAWLELQPTVYWDYLLWMDPANYGGILCLPEASSDPTADNNASAAPSVEMQWNIGDFLPPRVQQHFQVFVAEFIYRLHKALVEIRERDEGSSETSDAVDGGKSSPLAPFTRELIASNFSPRLFKIIPDLLRQGTTTTTTTSTAKVLGNSASEGGSRSSEDDLQNAQAMKRHANFLAMNCGSEMPALEFIKDLSVVLQLENSCRKETAQLRRNLLTLIQVREFSDRSQYVNPCISVKLTDVICQYCNFCRDLDLSRDPDLVASAEGRWSCAICRHEYPQDALEAQLVSVVQRQVLAFQLQDLKCVKCGLVKAENMTEYCKCSGAFTTLQPRAEFAARLQVYHKVAVFYKLAYLEQVLKWMEPLLPVPSLPVV